MRRSAVFPAIIFARMFARIFVGIVMLGSAAWDQMSAQTRVPRNSSPDVYLITIDTLRAEGYELRV